ncbi:MAG: hypothetical protein NXI20_17940 [bacterium]|nr:hypothetical protein [bacterium]
MENKLKVILVKTGLVALVALLMFIVGTFTAWSFKPVDWHPVGRAMSILFFMGISIVIVIQE